MNSLGTSDVLSRAVALQHRGGAGVIATIVENQSDLLIPVPTRLLYIEDGERVGDLEPRLRRYVDEDALACLNAGRSQLRSYLMEDDRLERTRPQAGNIDVFYEFLARTPRLVIVGAGHIAVPLARFGKLLDFEVWVIDDRVEYASRERFPDVDRILVGPYRSTIASLSIHVDTYVVLVTRGHVHDQACLEEVLTRDAAYVGMIGSRRRVRTVLEHAAANGHDRGRLERVFAPIGLDVQAHTPAEIAVAIMAEIINVRRGGRAPSLSHSERRRD